ncbi:MAG: MucR family transcriptional regulator [Pseudomonadota bacterium]
MTDNTTSHLVHLTSEIVSAFVSKNPLPSTGLPDLIRSVHGALSDISSDAPTDTPRPEPAVPVSKSITPDYLVCLEDGRQLKMLKRYLRSRYGMTPEEYRTRWNLPPDYPMVAPSYAKRRSEFAKEIGLGRKAG